MVHAEWSAGVMAMEPPGQIRIGGARKREKEPYTKTRTARVDLFLSVNTRPDLFLPVAPGFSLSGAQTEPKTWPAKRFPITPEK